MAAATAEPMTFTIPDLHAMTPFVGSFSPHYAKVVSESSAWAARFPVLTEKQRVSYIDAASQLLAAHTYPYADEERFRGICDFMCILFMCDEITDDQNGEGAQKSGVTLYNAMKSLDYDDGSALCKLVHEFNVRLLERCGPVTHRRFVEYWEMYLAAVTREAELRERGEILDPESYKKLRREGSSVRVCLVIAGYALGIDFPDEIFEHPAMMAMHLAITDMVCWSNDLYSYNREQSMGHGCNNVLTVLMKHKGLTLQGAVDYVGEYWKTLIDRYLNAKKNLPSWGEKIDEDVARYAKGIEHWVIGTLDWSFEMPRYFGAERLEVKETRVVLIRPSQVTGEHTEY
ncbi:terpenoid synthase [Cubamyces sp. BRFM 1775]|nr:terpenoid synthase [Cubamyces sp. BRFM 1775]